MIISGRVSSTVADAAWVPVTVTAVLAEPVIALTSRPAHLDGPLAWAAYLAWTAARGHATLPPPGERCTDFLLPLATWTAPAPGPVHPDAVTADGDVWGWACSRALYEPGGQATVRVRKHPALGPAARYTMARSWSLSAGPLRARDVPCPADLVTRIRWHALADPRALSVLLARIHGLGRLARHGHGRVLRWDVGTGGSRDAWQDRVMPQPGGAPQGIRAPYWHPSRRMPCTP
jgi:hypothetical protein